MIIITYNQWITKINISSSTGTKNSSYYSWVCSSAVLAWKRGIWVIILKRKYLYVSSILMFLAILSYFWLILLIVRHCTAYGCSNGSNKVGWETLSWHKYRSKHCFCYMSKEGTAEHLNMLFFGKICVWRYIPRTVYLRSLLLLLIMTQTPHFYARSHGNRWTAGSTVFNSLEDFGVMKFRY